MASSENIFTEGDLYELVEELTTTGEKNLNDKHLKELKRMCKKSNDNLQKVQCLLMMQLEKEHAEIRYSAFQIIDELFVRSHLFRQLVTKDFPRLLEFTVETKESTKLPPPLKVARSLRTLALARIEAWYNQFGKDYKRLELGYNYLKRVKKVDFAGIRSRTESERRRNDEQVNKQLKLEKRALDNVNSEMNSMVLDIESAITQANSCLKLIFPNLDDNDGNEGQETAEDVFPLRTSTQNAATDNDEEGLIDLEQNASDGNDAADIENFAEKEENFGPNHGIISRTYNIEIKFPVDKMHVKETEDNADLIKSFQDVVSEMKVKFLPVVSKWINILSKSTDVKSQLDMSLKLRNGMKDVLEKYNEIEIMQMMSKTVEESESEIESDCEDFVDVPEKIDPYFDEIGESPGGDFVLDSTSKPRNILEDTSATPGSSKDSEDDLRRRKLLTVAPVVAFDSDLRHWGEEKVHITPVVKNDSLHRFWHHAEFDEEFVPAGLEESLRTRAMNFSGEFQSVKWFCRAPMKNGKLCTRQDRLKCPFHGKIIARNEIGEPTKPEDAEFEIERKRKLEQKEAMEIQKDIQAAVGVNLGAIDVTRRKRRKKANIPADIKMKRYSRLTNLGKIENTSRKRLEKKVLQTGALAKVNETLSKIDKKRNLEKFGSNFNYLFDK
eukprot:gene20485-22501_t